MPRLVLSAERLVGLSKDPSYAWARSLAPLRGVKTTTKRSTCGSCRERPVRVTQIPPEVWQQLLAQPTLVADAKEIATQNGATDVAIALPNHEVLFI